MLPTDPRTLGSEIVHNTGRSETDWLKCLTQHFM